MTATSPPSAIPGPTPETRGKLVQASGSLMPTPFPNTQPSRNQPRDSTKSLIHGFRLSYIVFSAASAAAAYAIVDPASPSNAIKTTHSRRVIQSGYPRPAQAD